MITTAWKWLKRKVYVYRCAPCGHCFLLNRIATRCPRCGSSNLIDEK